MKKITWLLLFAAFTHIPNTLWGAINEKIVMEVLKTGDVNALVPGKSETLLHAICKTERRELSAEQLIDCSELVATILGKPGIIVDVLDELGATPLHYAARNNLYDVVVLLIKAGATINSPDMFGRVPLHYAALNGHAEVVQFLLRKGARRRIKDEQGYTPSGLAFGNDHMKIVELISMKQPNPISRPKTELPMNEYRLF
ncbi:MAG: ankyrin repeat domain-containing protein [Candidatus Babeliales bacterium]